jgi:uncharacterized protein DUF4184
MPFTLAHPAAVVPLARPLGRWAVLSALVIGSLVPDFTYFVPFPVARSRSHDLLGLFWFCMPMGFAMYTLFHAALAAPAIDLLPGPLRSRCSALRAARVAPATAAVAVSLLVGATSHIAWDAFTHAGAPIVRVSRALRFHLGTISGYPISVYTILQHTSTILGVALLVVWVRRWERTAPPATDAPPFAMEPGLRRVAAVAVAVLAIGLWLSSDDVRPLREPTLRGVQLFLRRAVPAAITSFSLAFAAYAAVWQIGARRAGVGRVTESVR